MKTIICILLFSSLIQQSYTQPNANTWTWIKGPTTINQAGYYGVQGVAAEPNNPGARSGAVTWTYNGKLYLFGGEGYDFFGNNGLLSDLWVFDPVTKNWTWLKGETDRDITGNYGSKGVESINNNPGGRHRGVAWVAQGKLYLFGGYGYAKTQSSSGSYLNDLWSYNPATNKWTWIKGSDEAGQAGTYGIKGTAAAANTPGARQDAAVCMLLGKAYLTGGTGKDKSVFTSSTLNDLWSFNPISNNWTWLNGTDAAEEGTPTTYGTLGVEAETNTPGNRQYHIMWAHNNKIYLMGGESMSFINGVKKTTSLSDVWEYNPFSNNWTWIKGPNTDQDNGSFGIQGIPSPTNTPNARRNHFSWYFNNKLYFMGGIGYANNFEGEYDYGFFNDLWEYNHITNNWTWLKGSPLRNVGGAYGTYRVANINNVPGVGQKSSTWVYEDKLYLFGGYKLNANRKNDLWEYIPADCLSSTLTVSNTIATGNYQAGTISSQSGGNTQVQAGSNVVLDAAKSIILLPNFEAKAGSVFKAQIGGCN